MSYRTSPADLDGMPPGIPYIIGNEAAERFSFYGMKAVLAVFMAGYLHLMDGAGGRPMSEAAATANTHWFNVAVYLTPLLGALLSDALLGKYRTIILLSVVYCGGHAALAFMGVFGHSAWWLVAGLALISLGSGGIKPCVSAHVGDQFGARNARLLPRIFAAFYFSINIGALLSMLITPWLLEWYGPHLAFGVPGVLMALATLVFWLGRNRFVHVPPAGARLFREARRGETLGILLRLLPLYLFVAVFWALFDQTGSTWVFQAQKMNLNFLGIDWLPAQIQSLNSLFVLTFIPLFSLVVYPRLERVVKLTPLRKIGAGFFFATSAFLLVAIVQSWIDAGRTPNISWQILACALLTAGEVLIAVVSLEFAYTQAPRSMKSLVMCFYLGAVALGNVLVATVNSVIQIPDSAAIQLREILKSDAPPPTSGEVPLPGYDGRTGTADDLLAHLRDGRLADLTLPGQNAFETAAQRVISTAKANRDTLPGEAGSLLDGLADPWGHSIDYLLLNADLARVSSPGPDGRAGTRWDLGMLIEVGRPDPPAGRSWTDVLRPSDPWLARRRAELGLSAPDGGAAGAEYSLAAYSGGQSRLHGAAYFRFFAWIMLGAAVLFIPYAVSYRPRTFLQE